LPLRRVSRRCKDNTKLDLKKTGCEGIKCIKLRILSDDESLLDLNIKFPHLSELSVTELWQLELVEEKLLASGTSRLLVA
jgi:hypothetical protein